MRNVADIPFLGCGASYRRELDALFAGDAAQVVEIVAEHYTMLDEVTSRDFLTPLVNRLPVLVHGLELSVASSEPIPPSRLDALRRLADVVDAPFVSDHLCYTRSANVGIGQLTPTVRSPSEAARIGDRLAEVQDVLDRPFLVENITFNFQLDAGLSESAFTAEVINRAGCYLLLDLANLLINSRNHGLDVDEFLDVVPLDRVLEIHLAGGHHDGSRWVDSHGYAVPEDVWDLFASILHRLPSLKAVIIERDQHLRADGLEEMRGDVLRAEALVRAALLA